MTVTFFFIPFLKMSKRKFVKVKLLELNEQITQIESNGGIIKRIIRNSNDVKNSKITAKLEINEYTDEDLEIVIGQF